MANTKPSGHGAASSSLAGIVVFHAPLPDSDHLWELRWLDLESRTNERLAYAYSGDEVFHTANRDAAWLVDAALTRDDDARGVLRIARDRDELAARFFPHIAIRGLDPDGTRAVIGHKPGYDSDVELVIATVTPHGIEPGEKLGLGMPSTEILGWLPDGGIIASRFRDSQRELVRVAAGTAPRVLREIPQGDILLSHDTRTLAWIPFDENDEDTHVLHIAAFEDPAAVRHVVRLGTAYEARCEFAANDCTIGCQLIDEDAHCAALAIDVATGRATKLGTKLAFERVFSPDGRSMILADDTMTIVPVDGAGPRTRLAIEGRPLAWLR